MSQMLWLSRFVLHQLTTSKVTLGSIKLEIYIASKVVSSVTVTGIYSQQNNCSTLWFGVFSGGIFTANLRSHFGCRLSRCQCVVWSVCLGSAEEFNLCYWLTPVFAWAKIRTFSAFLRLQRRRKQEGGREREGERERWGGRKWEKEKRENEMWNL